MASPSMSKKKFYFHVEDGFMDRAIEIAEEFKGVVKASRRRVKRKQLKVYGVGIDGKALETLLIREFGDEKAKLLDVKDVNRFGNLLMAVVPVAGLATSVAGIAVNELC